MRQFAPAEVLCHNHDEAGGGAALLVMARRMQLPASMLSELWETWRLPMLGLAAIALGVGAEIDGILRGEAITLLLALPVIALLASVRDATGWLRATGMAVGAVVVLMAALEVVFIAFPAAPIAQTKLVPDVSVRLPVGESEFEVDTTATLAAAGRQAHGRLALELGRNERHVRIQSEFAHSSGRQRVGRRSLQSGGFKVQQVSRERVSLPGDGDVDLHIASSSGAVLPGVDVAIRAVPLWSRLLPYVMSIAAACALALQAAAARRGIKTFIAAGVGVGVVLGPYLQHHLNPYAIGTSTLGAFFVAVGVGGGGGMVVCAVLDKLVAPQPT